ncbi:hypothetical protein [Pelagibaculum spongiae]|uniref:Lipoprotein n=1 Tax=Pelagibaculum spongiae TaxID=2080658 RepID=A0A2V1GQT5_9GAMM|nr:hypothetical protein [Pelagibaculum spongiae]PVZ66649.1 hypothetical protein DC094_15375 [Pelagibaculum spongiae]
MHYDKKKTFTCIMFMLLFGCSAEVDKGALSDQQICKGTIAAVMGRAPEIVKIDSVQGSVTHLSYIRPNDGKHWIYRCKLQGNRVIWATDTGRWRTDQYDSKITFSVNGNSLNIIQKYSDDSEGTKTYNKKQLGS